MNPWVAFIVRRIVGLVSVLFVLLVLTAAMIPLIPGDAALNVAGPDATKADVDRIRHELGMDEPLHVQIYNYIARLAGGSLGYSYLSYATGSGPISERRGEAVVEIIAARVPASAQLAVTSLVLCLTLGIGGGILFGVLTREGRHRRIELAFTAVTSVGAAIPGFLLATVLAFIFAVTLRWLPVAGTGTPAHLVLPVASIAIPIVLVLSRIVRVETLNALRQDYVRTARGKRLPELHIYTRHVLPNVVTAALTIGGLIFANLVGGALIVENVFARVGLGTQVVQALNTKDYPVVQAVVLMIACVVVLVNALVDITLAIIDPRSVARTS